MADVTDPPPPHHLTSPAAAPRLDVRDGSLLAAPVSPARPGTLVVLWSGSLADADAPDPRNWTAAAWDALDAAVNRWVAAGLGGSLLVRTHARHIVSDIPSAVRFAHRWRETGPRLLWDPASMLEDSMAAPAHAATHLERLIDALSHPDLALGVAAVALDDDRGPWDLALLDAARARCAELGVPAVALPRPNPA